MENETTEQRTMSLYQRISGPIKRGVAVAGLAMMVLGCSAAPHNLDSTPTPIKATPTNPSKVEEKIKHVYLGEDVPPWIGNPNMALEKKGGEETIGICGYGIGEAYDFDFRRETADEYARISIANSISRRIRGGFKKYNQNMGNQTTKEEVKKLEEVAKGYTNAKLEGSVKVSAWFPQGNPAIPGKEYSLVCMYLDGNFLDGLKTHLLKSKELSDELKDSINKDSENMHKWLEKEEQKYNPETNYQTN